MSTSPSIIERYTDEIVGVLGCFDRLIVTGTLPDCCHAGAMQAELVRRKMPFFDYGKLVNPLRNMLHENAQRLAREAGIEIEAVRKPKTFRKEARIAEILEKRGDRPGLVHIFSAPESCTCFKPWHNKATGKTSMQVSSGRCAHFYFYFIDELLGLCYLRVQTWAPFRLQFYCNGHNWLAGLLRRAKIPFTQQDNAFVEIAGFARAQELADAFDPGVLHRRLDKLAQLYCPVQQEFPSGWHWSIMQVEYATDIIFRRPECLKPLYECLTRRAIHTVKADDIATFLGRNGLNPNYQGEGGSRYNLLIEGSRLRHSLGHTSIKMYDKFNHVLRIETTTSDVGFFKHHRQVEHRNGSVTMENAPVQKTIYSLGIVRELLAAANRRYLDFISALEDDSTGRRSLDQVARPVRDEAGRPHRGINFFHEPDLALMLAVLRGEHTVSGLTARRLRRQVPGWSGGKVSRAIRRFRELGLLKKVAGTFKYYLTALGRATMIAGLRLREEIIIPAMTQPLVS